MTAKQLKNSTFFTTSLHGCFWTLLDGWSWITFAIFGLSTFFSGNAPELPKDFFIETKQLVIVIIYNFSQMFPPEWPPNLKGAAMFCFLLELTYFQCSLSNFSGFLMFIGGKERESWPQTSLSLKRDWK